MYPVAEYWILCCKSSQKVFYFISSTFATYAEGVEVDIGKEHQERIILNEYQSELKVESQLISDPLDMKMDVKEKIIWQHGPICHICFYDSVLNKRDLIQRVECKFKVGKTYHFYTNSFLGEEVMIILNCNSKLCLFHTKYVLC